MNVLFIGKRFYTGRDALTEEYGRIYQLPWHWAHAGIKTRLWLIDYHAREYAARQSGELEIVSTGVPSMTAARTWYAEMFNTRERPLVVVASGDCYIGLLAYLIAKRMRARFVFDVYDKYDEFGAYRRFPGFDPFAFLLRRANVRLFASRALLQRFGEPTYDILVPNGVDMLKFKVRDRDESRGLLGLPVDIQMIGYFGGMEPDRGVNDLIHAVQHLRTNGMSLEVLLGGRQCPDVDTSQAGVRYLGNVPFDEMPVALACCDMLAVPYRRSVFMDAGASNKIAEAIACARPLVATRTPNLVANFPAQAERLDSLLAIPGDSLDLARTIREQAVQQVLVDMPTGMSWHEISMAVAADLGLHANRVTTAQPRQS